MTDQSPFEHWERQQDRRIITIVKSNEGIPHIEWDENLSKDQVLACLVKVILFLTFDDYMDDILDEPEWQDPPPEGLEG